mmetsp:Transcript_23757/g.59953  ORF Transcript_23757/g.59953 Transcript_23757/m.59953 type:complete len:213 (-) Transcript_23757:29-667(-)
MDFSSSLLPSTPTISQSSATYLLILPALLLLPPLPDALFFPPFPPLLPVAFEADAEVEVEVVLGFFAAFSSSLALFPLLFLASGLRIASLPCPTTFSQFCDDSDTREGWTGCDVFSSFFSPFFPPFFSFFLNFRRKFFLSFLFIPGKSSAFPFPFPAWAGFFTPSPPFLPKCFPPFPAFCCCFCCFPPLPFFTATFCLPFPPPPPPPPPLPG